MRFGETAGEIDNSVMGVKELEVCSGTGESDCKQAPRCVGDIRSDNASVLEDKLTSTWDDRMACQTSEKDCFDSFQEHTDYAHESTVIQVSPDNIASPQNVNNHNEVQSLCITESSSVVMSSTGNDPNRLDEGQLPAIPHLLDKSRMLRSEARYCNGAYTKGEISCSNDEAHLKNRSAAHGSVLSRNMTHSTQEVDYQIQQSTKDNFARKVNGGPPQGWKSADRSAHEADGSNAPQDNQEGVAAKVQMLDDHLGKSNFPFLNDDSQLSSVTSVDTYDFSQDTQNCDCSISTPDNKLQLPTWNRCECESLQRLSQDKDAVVPDIAAQRIGSPLITMHVDCLRDRTGLDEDLSIVNISETEQSVPEMNPEIKESCYGGTGNSSNRREDTVPGEVELAQRVKSNTRVAFLQTLDISFRGKFPSEESQEIDTDFAITPSNDNLGRNGNQTLSQAFAGELSCDHAVTRNKESTHLDCQISAVVTEASTVRGVENITSSLQGSDNGDGVTKYPAAAGSEEPFQVLSVSHMSGHDLVPGRISHTRELMAKDGYPNVGNEVEAHASRRDGVATETTLDMYNELEQNGAEYAVKAYKTSQASQFEEDFSPSKETVASVQQPDCLNAWMHDVSDDTVENQVTSEGAVLCTHGLAEDPPDMSVVLSNPDTMDRSSIGNGDDSCFGKNRFEPKCSKPKYMKPEKHQSTISVLPHPNNLRRPLMKRNTGTFCQEKLSSKHVSPRNEISWKQFKSSETVKRHRLPVMMSEKCTRDDEDIDYHVVHELVDETARLGAWPGIPSHHSYLGDDNSRSLSFAAVQGDEIEPLCRNPARSFNVEDTLLEERIKLFQERMGTHHIDDVQRRHHSTDLCSSGCIPSESSSAWFYPVSSQASISELCMNKETSECSTASKRYKNLPDDYFSPTTRGDHLHSGTQSMDEQILSPFFRSQHDCEPSPQGSCNDVLHLYSSRQPDLLKLVDKQELPSRSSSVNLNDSKSRVVLRSVFPKLQPLSQTSTPVSVIEYSQDHASPDVTFLDSGDKERVLVVLHVTVHL
ncbi:uncharacterized protein [Diadema setosum]|uniref:uncharacterized protein n=1 Tax=Diadema setosum TaxID=31175 RepID=UPI003B3A3A95